MSELRSTNPDHSPSNYSSAQISVSQKIDALLATMDPELRTAIETLSKADPETRRTILESVDPATRKTLEAFIQHLS